MLSRLVHVLHHRYLHGQAYRQAQRYCSTAKIFPVVYYGVCGISLLQAIDRAAATQHLALDAIILLVKLF
jgi:hypothetical protein